MDDRQPKTVAGRDLHVSFTRPRVDVWDTVEVSEARQQLVQWRFVWYAWNQHM